MMSLIAINQCLVFAFSFLLCILELRESDLLVLMQRASRYECKRLRLQCVCYSKGRLSGREGGKREREREREREARAAEPEAVLALGMKGETKCKCKNGSALVDWGVRFGSREELPKALSL